MTATPTRATKDYVAALEDSIMTVDELASSSTSKFADADAAEL